MLNVQTLFDFRITVGILIHNLGAQLEKVLNHRLPLISAAGVLEILQFYLLLWKKREKTFTANFPM